MCAHEKLARKLAELDGKLKEAKETLEWYADESNYVQVGRDKPILRDGGLNANAALEQLIDDEDLTR